MTITTASYSHWAQVTLRTPTEVGTVDDVSSMAPGKAPLTPHVLRIIAGDDGLAPRVDAWLHMARNLHQHTGWEIPELLPMEREYVSRLWAEDWDSSEDSVYDE